MTPTKLLFLDWGQPALIRESVPYYDPDTGQMEESEAETSVLVVPGQRLQQPLKATASVADDITHNFLVQADELPAALQLENSQLIVGSRHYTVREITSSPITSLVLLQCTDVTCSISS